VTPACVRCGAAPAQPTALVKCESWKLDKGDGGWLRTTWWECPRQPCDVVVPALDTYGIGLLEERQG